ncbi:hypothetical protein [Kistimonas asteriae]|uniref:hypothetical protein n=1 Tax=Kistimonas asteriae TaxID=517724 RepID=UPI001BA89FBB|nr:hypothetical protein [Kistimonas asteriae]
MNEDTVKQLALIIAANCLENGIVDELHGKGTITDEQKQAFNKQVGDRIYTFLLYLLNKPSQQYSALLEALAQKYPEDWSLPELDTHFTEIAGKAVQMPHNGPQ